MDLLSKVGYTVVRSFLDLWPEGDWQVAERNKSRLFWTTYSRAGMAVWDSGPPTLFLCLCYQLALDEQQLETQVQDELRHRPRRLRWRPIRYWIVPFRIPECRIMITRPTSGTWSNEARILVVSKSRLLECFLPSLSFLFTVSLFHGAVFINFDLWSRKAGK
jgi:hypothetical protein